MERKTTIRIIIAVVVIALGLILLSGTITHEQKCFVWKNVDDKFESGGYNVVITDNGAGLMLPVENWTYSHVKVGQSYNFYCDKTIWRGWACHFSYECGEMG